MPLKVRRLHFLITGITLITLLVFFIGFDFYARHSAEEVIGTVLSAEAASLQQGNLLLSMSKLQTAVQTSESLKGVYVYDRSLPKSHRYPLISFGPIHAVPLEDEPQPMARSGIFAYEFTRNLPIGKAAVFHFRFGFLRWGYWIFSALLLVFGATLARLIRRIEQARSDERAALIHAISEQVAHDIRSPLSAVKIFAGVARQKGIETELLSAASQRIEEIVEDLKFRHSKEQGLFDMHSQFDAAPLIQKVIEEAAVRFPRIQFDFKSGGSQVLKGPISQFRRAVSNLISNAAEASPEGSRVEVRFMRRGDKVQIEIADHGRGIPQEIQSQLFRRGATFGKSSGSGLGLYHAKQVAKAMHGTISLKSMPNQGTEVTMTF